ncbi:hypothetical protein LZQ00_07760 [Sphingobacterium sp. SRCM116780]|uniref:hypothetical protein n=1 Tax=Sphingobacterium sp. SRCM116780 TaxID=2907623 RepID=UPI001F1699F2|nr:hypothetical protein [Sphingobacterium sp. SRCM116780]UIR57706.1 hypothetical protein LZQ00_07760 [Sphingobacterium sp. SRCM116780]
MPKETKKGLYQGIIEKDAKGNYFCGPYLLDYQLVESNFRLGDKVSIKKIVGNTSRKSFEDYPQKSIKFSLVGEDNDN